MRIAINNALQGIPCAETELAERYRIAGLNLGWDVRPVFLAKEIDDFDPDFVLALHFWRPKLTRHATYACQWNPVSYLTQYFDMIKYAFTYDAHFIGSDAIGKWVRQLHASSPHPPQVMQPFYPSCHSTIYEPLDFAKAKFFYCAIWASRNQDFFQKIAENGVLDIYGPNPILYDEVFKTNYKGQIPFDGVSVLEKIRQSGAAFCFQSTDHMEYGVPSMRIFETVAAGAAAICQRHPFIEEAFSDLVFYVDTDASESEQFDQAINHLAWIRSHPDDVRERTREAHRIFTERYSLERMLESAVEFHNNTSIVNFAKRGIPPKSLGKINVIVQVKGSDSTSVEKMVQSVRSQNYNDLAIIFTGGGALSTRAKAVRMLANKFSVEDVGCGQSRCAELTKALSAVTADYFAYIDDTMEWFPNHLTSLATALAVGPDWWTYAAYSGHVSLRDVPLPDGPTGLIFHSPQGAVRDVEDFYFETPDSWFIKGKTSSFPASRAFLAKSWLIPPSFENAESFECVDHYLWYLLFKCTHKINFSMQLTARSFTNPSVAELAPFPGLEALRKPAHDTRTLDGLRSLAATMGVREEELNQQRTRRIGWMLGFSDATLAGDGIIDARRISQQPESERNLLHSEILDTGVDAGPKSGRLRVLLVQLSANGDCLYATTLARQIKKDNPYCHLTWAISTKCSHILLNNPDVDEVWEVPMADWSGDEQLAMWNRFEVELEKVRKERLYDRIIVSQLYPHNFHRYDGTIRPSILRSYENEITVPINSVLIPTEEETRKAGEFIEQFDLNQAKNVLLFECASKSGQSYVTPSWAYKVAELVVRQIPDLKIILSSGTRIKKPTSHIVDGSILSMRETAAILPWCTIFAGCGSGLTVIATTLEQSPKEMPIVQFIYDNMSVFASFREDFEYWGLGGERFIESSIKNPSEAAQMLVSLVKNGMEWTRRHYHNPPPLSFEYYLSVLRFSQIGRDRWIEVAQSLLLTTERFGWHESLIRFTDDELLPRLVASATSDKPEIIEAITAIHNSKNEYFLTSRLSMQIRGTTTYAVTELADIQLPHPMRIEVASSKDIQRLLNACEISEASLGDKMKHTRCECPKKHRGESIAACGFKGHWLGASPSGSGETARVGDAKFHRISKWSLEANIRRPFIKRQIISILRWFGMEEQGRKFWRLTREVKKGDRTVSEASRLLAKKTLQMAGLLHFARRLRSTFAGRRSAKTVQIGSNKNSSLPLEKRSGYKIVLVNDFGSYHEVERQLNGNIIRLAPRYGMPPPKFDQHFIRPAKNSFIKWVAYYGEHTPLLNGDGMYLFTSYRERMKDVCFLKGFLQPEQSIGLLNEDVEEGILFKDWSEVRHDVATGVTYHTRPPSDWLENNKPQLESYPSISIVIPSFNQGIFIREALDSVLDQGYLNLELIVLDPGSTDETRHILERYRKKIAHLILEPDDGQSDALTRGLNMAKGEILTWLCADDKLEPHSLFHIAEAFNRHDVDIVVGGCRRIDEANKTLHLHHSSLPFQEKTKLSAVDIMDITGSWDMGNYFYQPEVFFTKKIWEKSGAFLWHDAYYAMDYDLWLRMALAGATIVHILPLITASRDQNGQKTKLSTGEKPWLWQYGNFMRFYKRVFSSMLPLRQD